MAPTRSSRERADDARASSHAVTPEGTELVEFGVTSSRPNVARSPASRACLLAARAVIAYVSIGSARSSMRVVPAWSADPVKSYR